METIDWIVEDVPVIYPFDDVWVLGDIGRTGNVYVFHRCRDLAFYDRKYSIAKLVCQICKDPVPPELRVACNLMNM